MNNKKILVITSNDDVFDKLHIEFEPPEYELKRITNPLMYIEAVSGNDFFAIIADLKMKDIYMMDMLNGSGFVDKSVPIVALSSDITADNILLTYEFGLLDIYPKDYKIGAVRKAIERAVNTVS